MSEDTVMIHVRQAPDGSITEIAERPLNATPQAWFDLLSERAGDKYQTFAGGRGLFRLPRERIEAFKAEIAA